MEARNEQLASLFHKIFTASGLVRFVRKNYGTQLAGLTLRKSSESGQIRRIVDEMLDHGVVDNRLFDLLVEADPDIADLIERVRTEFVPPEETARSSTQSADDEPEDRELSAERLAWRRRLEGSLANVERSTPKTPIAWIYAAAVLPDFNPVKLKPYIADGEADGDLLALAAHCYTRYDGGWELHLHRRRDALNELWQKGEIAAALDCNPHEKSLQSDLLKALSQSHPLPFESIANYPTLLAAIDVADWLVGVDAELFNIDRAHAAVERYERIEPLRKLVGKHFRGRKDELDTLNDHTRDAQSDTPILTVWGIGGAGKSTILGKHLLGLGEGNVLPPPWAYVDFDDPAVDPTDQRGILEHIARHLGLLYAGAEVGDDAQDLDDAFIGLESASSTDYRREIDFAVDTTDSNETRSLVEALSAAIDDLPMEPSLLLVLDTFEQVQVRGNYAVDRVRELIDEILDVIPYARIVVSGRGDVSQWVDARDLKIGDLDPESADQVLLALGVEKPESRKIVIEELGTNPLTLRLIADGIKSGRLAEEDLKELVVGARSIQLQGHLYTRILGHIKDGEIRRLAHPGLIVRRVSRGVIADVLAEICEITVDRIPRLLEKLPLNVALFEPDESMPDEGPALRHRQDVREKMLALMVEDPAWRIQLATIHDRAIEHYANFDHPIARAEELYHRLMREDELVDLDPLWSEEIAASLSRSWDDPLPHRARLWLGARVGRLEDTADVELRVADRELGVAREVRSHMLSKDFDGALSLLASATERSAGSPLFALEARALTALGRHAESLDVAEAGLVVLDETKFARLVMELHQLAAAAAFEVSGFDAVIQHSDEAIRIANALGDTNANLVMLDLQVRTEQKQGDAEDVKTSAQALESKFLNADEHELRNVPDVSEQIISTLGAGSPGVLKKAALTFGNREQQTVINQDVFQLEQLLEGAKSKGSATLDLSHLATQVGLPASNYKMGDLAGAAIRYGRMGDALAVVLDHAGGDKLIRQQTMSMFNLQKEFKQ